MESDSYRKAGVDTAAGRSFAARIRQSMASTHAPAVIQGRSDFAALFDLRILQDYREPLLVSAADGVGTKLHLASLFDCHEAVGIDLVAMCLNDLLTTGARPLIFLDYIACGKLEQQRMAQIIASIAEGCRQAGCSLVGGETAEHPGVMAPDHYDLAGFAVGVVEKSRLIDGSQIEVGDLLIGLPSSGLHSNGFSLLRQLFLKDGLHLPDSPEDRDFLLREAVARPTLIYEPVVRPLLNSSSPSSASPDSGCVVKGMAHITGGGFYENIPRILAPHLSILLEREAWHIPPVFAQIAERGQLKRDEMHAVFNMGIGFVLVVAAEEGRRALQILQESFSRHYPQIEGQAAQIGRVVDENMLKQKRFRVGKPENSKPDDSKSEHSEPRGSKPEDSAPTSPASSRLFWSSGP